MATRRPTNGALPAEEGQPNQRDNPRLRAPVPDTPNLTQPGKVPKGTYKTEYFFAGQMTVVFNQWWAVIEVSTGELAAVKRKETCEEMSFLGKACIR